MALVVLQRYLHARTGWVAVAGGVFTYGCIRQFNPLIKKAGFTKPSVLTINAKEYARKYKDAMESASDLSAHIRLMYWDSAFAVTKGITCYALLYMLTGGAEWPAHTVPAHAALNLLENLFTIIAIKGFTNDQSVHPLVQALPIVTTMKWSLAVVNTGSIPVLAVYRGFQKGSTWNYH